MAILSTIKSKNANSSSVVKTILLFFTFNSLSFIANAQTVESDIVKYPMLSNWEAYFLLAIVIILFFVVLMLVKIWSNLMGIKLFLFSKTNLFTSKDGKTFFQRFNNTVAIEEEDSLDLAHNYDGIRELDNKVFCTFTDLDNLHSLLEDIKSQYTIIYNKMFVLEIVGKDEYVVTYNVDQGNVYSIPDNTILVHRKKESNTLYTINALNELIKGLNGGIVDTKFKVDWQHYKNCILLTQHNTFNQLNTKIYKIIEV